MDDLSDVELEPRRKFAHECLDLERLLDQGCLADTSLCIALMIRLRARVEHLRELNNLAHDENPDSEHQFRCMSIQLRE